MTRGNQRDLAREKAAKKNKGKAQAASEQGANQGLTKEQRWVQYYCWWYGVKWCPESYFFLLTTFELLSRMERDAQRMREKQAKKAADAEAAGGSGAGKK